MMGAFLFLLSGCLDERIHWSPDGRRALLIAQDGLHLTSADGRLSAPLLSGVKRAAWLGDSSRAILAVERSTRDWAHCGELIGKSKLADAEKSALEGLTRLEKGELWKDVSHALHGHGHAPLLYLAANKLDVLRGRLNADELKQLQETEFSYSEILVVEVGADSIKVQRVLARTEQPVQNLRPSPDGMAWLTALSQTGQPITISEKTSAFPDWTSDSRRIVFCALPDTATPSTDSAAMAVIASLRVRSEEGSIDVEKERDELAGVLFDSATKVRCLKDGRILFSSADITLPASKAEIKEANQTLCLLDLARHPKVMRPIIQSEKPKLPSLLAYFEPNPEGTRVLFCGADTEVSVLSLATGEVEVVQKASDKGHSAMGAWRNNGEFTYYRKHPAYETLREGDKEPTRRFELVQHGGTEERVLSTDWSDDFMSKLAPGK